MVTFGQRNVNDTEGLSGYEVPYMQYPHRPLNTLISKAKPYGGMIDSALKSNKIVPGPNKYMLEKYFNMNLARRNPIVTRSPRRFESEEI